MKKIFAFVLAVGLMCCSSGAVAPESVTDNTAEFKVISCFYYNDMMINKETGVIFDTSDFNQSALVSGGLYRVLTDTKYSDIYDFDLWDDVELYELNKMYISETKEG